MPPLLMQLLREKSRSTIIYVLFAILIIVFVFTFNTSGSGGCTGSSPLTEELASVGEDVVDIGLLRTGMSLSDGRDSTGEKTDADSHLTTRFPGLHPELNRLTWALAGLQYLPPDSIVFGDSVPTRYAGFRRPTTPEDQVKSIRVFNDLVETILVAREARKLGLTAGQDEIHDRVLWDAFYDPETKEFKKDTLQRYLAELGMSSERYQELVGMEILREKVIDLIASLVFVPAAELDGLFRDVTDQVKIEYVEVDPDVIAPLCPVTEADIAAATKDTEALKKHYTEHEKEYKKPATVRVRGLLVKAPSQEDIEKATSDEQRSKIEKERSQALAKATQLLAQLALPSTPSPLVNPGGPGQAGPPDEKKDKPPTVGEKAAEPPAEGEKPAEPPAEGEKAGEEPKDTEPPDPFEEARKRFEKLASEKSDGDRKSQGGLYDEDMSRVDLDYHFGKAVAEAAISLRKGDHTGVVEGKGGYWILFAEEANAGKDVSLEQATPEIAAALARQRKAPEWAKKVAGELLEQARKDPKKSLEDVVAAWNTEHRPPKAGPAEPGKSDRSDPGGPRQQPPPGAVDDGADTYSPPPENVKGESDPPSRLGGEPAPPPAGQPAVVPPPAGEQPPPPDPVEKTGDEPPAAPPAEPEKKVGDEPTAIPGAEPEGGAGEVPPAAPTGGPETKTGEEKPAGEPDKVPEVIHTIPAEDVPEEAADEPFAGMLVRLVTPVARLAQTKLLDMQMYAYPRGQYAGYEDEDAKTAFDVKDGEWADVPGFGINERLLFAVLQLTAESPVPLEVFTSADGKKHYVVRFKERVEMPEAEAKKARNVIERRILGIRQREAYRAWYWSVHAKAMADGDIEPAKAWTDMRDSSWDAYTSALSKKPAPSIE